jgi:hypothetical protein
MGAPIINNYINIIVYSWIFVKTRTARARTHVCSKIYNMSKYTVIHQYLFMGDTIFEHLKYQLDQKISDNYRC